MDGAQLSLCVKANLVTPLLSLTLGVSWVEVVVVSRVGREERERGGAPKSCSKQRGGRGGKRSLFSATEI